MLWFERFDLRVAEELPELEYVKDEPMSRHTSFRIGGPVEVMAFPKSPEELSKLLKVSALLDVNPVILGAGTNVLAPDEGLPGLVICLKDCLDGMEQTGEHTIRVMAGVTMTRAAVFAANLGLSGLEFAHGIPGTVGGGVYMNAGAYGGEMKDVVTAVTVLTKDGEIRKLSKEEMNFRYRGSVIEDEGYIVLEAEMELKEGNLEEIQERMAELTVQRKTKQPIEYPSAGSTFKRPEGYFAGKLVQDAGLRGFQVGGAQVSEKHCGFVINAGGATAADVMQLMKEVSEKVQKEFGVTLEPEVKRIGEF